MNEISEPPINHAFIDEIIKAPSTNLFFYDGELLTHFRAAKDYFVFWLDCDVVCRWALVELSPESVENYLADKVDLRETLLSGPSWVFDTDSEGVLRAWKMEIPEECLPLVGCFYNEIK